LRQLDDEIDVHGRMEIFDLRARRLARAPLLDPRRNPGALELGDERVVSIRPERMTVREAVRGDLGPGDDDHRCAPVAAAPGRFAFTLRFTIIAARERLSSAFL